MVWQALRKAFGEGRKAQVAVAFLGQGSFARMPLTAGSVLVVNANIDVVKSGQTDPRELLKYVNAGVRVFTHASLHAKVYVIGRAAFVGSANVSFNSESKLVESALLCSDTATVRKAREFVMGLAIERLGPEALRQLQKHYRPPKLFVQGARTSKTKARQTNHPLAVALATCDWTDEAREANNKGEPIARKKLRNSRDFRIEDFQLIGKRMIQRMQEGRYVYQVLQEGRTTRLHPGGGIVHVEHFKERGRPSIIVYVELRRRRRARKLTSLPAEIKPTSRMLKKLRGIREIKNQQHAAALARLFD